MQITPSARTHTHTQSRVKECLFQVLHNRTAGSQSEACAWIFSGKHVMHKIESCTNFCVRVCV